MVRFSKVLGVAINDNHEAKEYGTHFIRKGIASFAYSGTTAGLPIVSVCLRWGWSLGGVQDRYFRYESAGDQYLGRVVAGLTVNQSAFAMLPPHFSNPQDHFVIKCVGQIFRRCIMNPICLEY
ncbi:hypothetical protein JG687_00018389 [Phytophthora cactorum]|uniref:Uncharacterized protein n=1 Tax=Phytophthora cactorum TaxID=29920 RepID=A0A8T1TP10_9STRA|nr:hypothetical protein JG687_00018389 [Phytophthora cactorum]